MSRSSMYSFPPTPQDWTQIQEAVRVYYVNQKLPLKEVRAVLRDRHGFRATDRMIKARLKQWGCLKNAKKEDWHFLALLYQQRKDRGRVPTVFDVRGHRKTVKDLQRFIRNQGMTTEQFIEEARQTSGNKQIPDYIQALIPDSRVYQGSPPDDISPEYLTPSPPQVLAQLRCQPQPTHQSQLTYHLEPADHLRPRSTSASSHEYGSTISPHPMTNMQRSPNMQDSASTCTHLQMEFEMCASQITRPSPLMSGMGEEEISSWALLQNSPTNSDRSSGSFDFVCSRCNQPSNEHFISLDNFDPYQHQARRDILNGDDHTLHLPVSTKDEGSWLWVARCFLACMLLKKGKNEAAEQSLREAANEFERLIQKKDRLLLTAAGHVLTILHMHDQGEIAKKIMTSAHEVVQRLLPKEHPVRETIFYLVASAAIQQREYCISSETLRTIVQNLSYYHPDTHEHIITARYNYAWMLKFEDRLEEAEAEARAVYILSSRILGKNHMQSITALAVVASCIFPDMSRADECISTFGDVIENASSTLGAHHPYTLEAKRRMAEKMVEQSGSNVDTLNLYREIMYGRAKMLGPNHSYTIGAANRYEEELKTLRLWEDRRGRPSLQQLEIDELFTPQSPTSWTHIIRRKLSNSQTIQKPMKDEFDENDMLDEDDDVVIVDGRQSRSQSPGSTNEFRAY